MKALEPILKQLNKDLQLELDFDKIPPIPEDAKTDKDSDLYCSCKEPRSKTMEVLGKVHSVCAYSLGGCGKEIK